MPSSLMFGRFLGPNLYFVFSAPGSVSDADLDHVMDELLTVDPAKPVRVFAYSSGVISPAQRQRVTTRMKGRELEAAVIVDGALTRGIITAIGWVLGGVRAFSPDNCDAAHAYLRLSKAEIAVVDAATRQARSQVTSPPRSASPG